MIIGSGSNVVYPDSSTKIKEDLALIHTLQWHPNLPWLRVYGTTNITTSKAETSL